MGASSRWVCLPDPSERQHSYLFSVLCSLPPESQVFPRYLEFWWWFKGSSLAMLTVRMLVNVHSTHWSRPRSVYLTIDIIYDLTLAELLLMSHSYPTRPGAPIPIAAILKVHMCLYKFIYNGTGQVAMYTVLCRLYDVGLHWQSDLLSDALAKNTAIGKGNMKIRSEC